MSSSSLSLSWRWLALHWSLHGNDNGDISLGLGFLNQFFVGFCFGLILNWICDELSYLFELVCFVWVFSFQFLDLWWVFSLGLFWVESRKRERESGRERKNQGQIESRGWERREKIYLKNKMESYNNHTYLHSYCNIFVYAQC